jgi:hypothetical protein
MKAHNFSKKIRLRSRINSVGKSFLIIVAVIFSGFSGGLFSPFFVGWFRSSQLSGNTNAISVANTFIVFVTLIFIVVTVLVTIAAYIFSSQIVHSKLSMQMDFVEEIAEKLNQDDEMSLGLAEAILGNAVITERIADAMETKIPDLVRRFVENSGHSEEDLSSIAGGLK